MTHSRDLSKSSKEQPIPVNSGQSGHQGLNMEEALLFELDSKGKSGVDLPTVPKFENRLGSVSRDSNIGLPGLSEPEVIRHYTRLSQKNYAIDTGIYPLGSCTMKHNPSEQWCKRNTVKP